MGDVKRYSLLLVDGGTQHHLIEREAGGWIEAPDYDADIEALNSVINSGGVEIHRLTDEATALRSQLEEVTRERDALERERDALERGIREELSSISVFMRGLREEEPLEGGGLGITYSTDDAVKNISELLLSARKCALDGTEGEG